MNDLYDLMLSAYDTSRDKQARNAMYEVTQQIILMGLYDGGFFEKAAFYGDTCLRIFYGLKRFSENMNFSLFQKGKSFHLENYFNAIVNAFALAGRKVVIRKKNKNENIESEFLKDNTEIFNISLKTEKSIIIKIEVDIDSPLHFDTEQKLLIQPKSFMTRCFVMPDLFACKMHTLISHTWKNRLEGRDWYDFEWFVRKGCPLNYNHLKERIKQSLGIEMQKEEFHKKLLEHLGTADIGRVKRDALPFVKKNNELAIWSNDYFVQLAGMIKYK